MQLIARQVLHQPRLELVPETTAADVDGWDSVAHARLMLQIEEDFAVSLPSERLFDLDSVGDLVALLHDLLNR
ncbi:Carrier domain-containing protein [Azospirillaceae bacterium]